MPSGESCLPLRFTTGSVSRDPERFHLSGSRDTDPAVGLKGTERSPDGNRISRRVLVRLVRPASSAAMAGPQNLFCLDQRRGSRWRAAWKATQQGMRRWMQARMGSRLRDRKRSLKLQAANDRIDEDFLMRARARPFGFFRPWPALENLSGRKPRGLVGVYGESALGVGAEAAGEALPRGPVWAVCLFPLGVFGGCNRGRGRFAFFGRPAGPAGSRGCARRGRGSRSSMDWVNRDFVMLPVPGAAHGIAGPRHA